MIGEPLPPEVQSSLRALTRAILKHPIAARSVYAALVAEGRRFKETEEGRLLHERISRSEIAGRIATSWEITSLGLLDPSEPPDRLPSAVVEALARAAAEPFFEGKIAHALGMTEARRP